MGRSLTLFRSEGPLAVPRGRFVSAQRAGSLKEVPSWSHLHGSVGMLEKDVGGGVSAGRRERRA